LAGVGNGDILGHEVVIFADEYTELDAELIPTGEIKSVKGTPFDFTSPHKVGERIEQAGGYDLNYVLKNPGDLSQPVAKVYESESGRVMQVFSTQPGIQFYTGNFLDGSKGKGAIYTKYSGLCLETQHFPDAPNHSNFPSIVLKPDQKYKHRTVFKFEAE
jgi:aldose 1-epimerase